MNRSEGAKIVRPPQKNSLDPLLQLSITESLLKGKMVQEFQLIGWRFFQHIENKTGERMLFVEMTLSRQFFSIFMVTYLPTILMNIINQESLYA